MSRTLKFISRLAISAGLITWFLVSLSRRYGGVDRALEQVFLHLKSVSPVLLLMAGFLTLVGKVLISIRWKILLDVHTRGAVWKELFSYYLMAAFFNSFLPSTIGGDTLRAAKSRRIAGKTSFSVTTIIVERMTGLFALVTIVMASFAVGPRPGLQGVPPGQIFIFLCGVAVFLTLLILMTLPRVADWILERINPLLPLRLRAPLGNVAQGIQVFYRHPRRLALAFLMSLIFQTNMVLYYFLILRGVGVSIGFGESMMKVPVVIFFLMVVPAVNGMGVRTTGFAVLMALKTQALVIEIVDLVIRMAIGLVGGVVYLVGGERTARNGENRDTENPE